MTIIAHARRIYPWPSNDEMLHFAAGLDDGTARVCRASSAADVVCWAVPAADAIDRIPYGTDATGDELAARLTWVSGRSAVFRPVAPPDFIGAF